MMDTPAAEVLVPLISMTAIFGIVYVITSAKHKQRMALIEKGLSKEDVFVGPDPYRSLKMGMLSIGIGIGLLVGYILETYVMISADDNPLPYLIAVAIFGGVALIWHYFIVQRKEKLQ